MYKYFKIMAKGATICCIETEQNVNMENVYKMLVELGMMPVTINVLTDSLVDRIIELGKGEAYDDYDVVTYPKPELVKQEDENLESLFFCAVSELSDYISKNEILSALNITEEQLEEYGIIITSLNEVVRVNKQHKLSYDELGEGYEVYVNYSNDGTFWSEETRKTIKNGIETVHKDKSGDYYTVDKRGSILSNLAYCIEVGGVKIYATK